MSYRMEILESRLFVKAWFDRTCEPQTKKYYHCMLNDLFKEIIFYLFKIVSNQIPEHKFIRKNTNFRITAALVCPLTTMSHKLRVRFRSIDPWLKWITLTFVYLQSDSRLTWFETWIFISTISKRFVEDVHVRSWW